MPRKTYYVSPSGSGWKLTKDGGFVLGTYASKDGAQQAAKIVANANRPSQVKVQRRDGTFQTEWTYGSDPFPPPG